MTQHLFEKEFSEDYAIPDQLLSYLTAAGWEDVSWHNDACPSFQKNDLRLWVDAEDAELRDIKESKRFSLARVDEDGMYASDIDASESLGGCFEILARAQTKTLSRQFEKPHDIRRYMLFLGFLGMDYHIDDDIDSIRWQRDVTPEQRTELKQNHEALWSAAEQFGINPWDQFPELEEIELMREMRPGFDYKGQFVIDPFNVTKDGQDYPVDPVKMYGSALGYNPKQDSAPGPSMS